MRSFYQKKVQDIQQSHKKSIAALKKGAIDTATAEYVTDNEQELANVDDSGNADSPYETKAMNQQTGSSPHPAVGLDSEKKMLQARDVSHEHISQKADPKFVLSNEIIGLHFQQQQQQYNQQQLVIMHQQNQIQQLENLIRLSSLNRERPSRENSPEFRSKPSDGAIQTELDMLRSRVSRDEAAINGLHQEIKELLVRNAQLTAEIDLLNQAPKSPRLEQFQVFLFFIEFDSSSLF